MINPPAHRGRDGVTDERLARLERYARKHGLTGTLPKNELLAVVTELQSRRSHTPPAPDRDGACLILAGVRLQADDARREGRYLDAMTLDAAAGTIVSLRASPPGEAVEGVAKAIRAAEDEYDLDPPADGEDYEAWMDGRYRHMAARALLACPSEPNHAGSMNPSSFDRDAE